MNKFFYTILLAPRNIGISLIKAYQATLSKTYGDVCRFYPSCSHYTATAIAHRGIVLGIFYGLTRIIRCNPWSAGGVTEEIKLTNTRYRVTHKGWVVAKYDSIHGEKNLHLIDENAHQFFLENDISPHRSKENKSNHSKTKSLTKRNTSTLRFQGELG